MSKDNKKMSKQTSPRLIWSIVMVIKKPPQVLHAANRKIKLTRCLAAGIFSIFVLPLQEAQSTFNGGTYGSGKYSK